MFPSQIEEILLKDPRLSPHYVLEVTREGPLDAVTVQVEGRSGSSADEHAQAGKELQHNIKALIGITAGVVIQPAESIPRSMGKVQRIIDKR